MALRATHSRCGQHELKDNIRLKIKSRLLELNRQSPEAAFFLKYLQMFI